MNRLKICLLAALAFLGLAVPDAHALLCRDFFHPSVLQSLPNRVLNARELAEFAKNYALQNQTKIRQLINAEKPHADGRVYIKLVDQDNVSVWVHRWVGVETSIHDHVDSIASIYVVEGTVREEFFRPPDPKPTARFLEEGRAIGMGALPYTHRLYGEDDAISVHAYSPKLDHMSYYVVDPETQQLRINRRWQSP